MTLGHEYIVYPDSHPEPKATFSLQIWDWLSNMARLTGLFYYHNREGFLLPYYS